MLIFEHIKRFRIMIKRIKSLLRFSDSILNRILVDLKLKNAKQLAFFLTNFKIN